MPEWFQAKVKFLRQMDNGLIKKITEQYLVDSMSFTECEACVMKEVGEGMREITMVAVAKSNVKEVVFRGDTDLWFKVKVAYKLMDEDSEKEKKITTYLLVNAADAKEAYERTEEHYKEMLVPFQITKIEESPIIDVYRYEKAAPRGYVKVENNDIGGHSEAVKKEADAGNPADDEGPSEKLWKSRPQETRDSIIYSIRDGHYNEDVQGRFLEQNLASDAARHGIELKAFKDLVDYVEICVLSLHDREDE